MDSTPTSPHGSGSYEEFFGFVQPPFALTPDPRFLYRSTSHEDAITLLVQALRRKEGFIVLTGDIGTGKTTICRALMQQLDPNTFTSLVLNPFLSVEELLRETLLDFGVLSREAVRSGRVAAASTHDLVSTLHDFLLSLVPINGSAVMIIDEAQHLSSQVLEQIRVLSNLETNQAKLLQIVLVGQLNLLDSLGQADMRQLNQRVSLRATLKPLTREEVEAYIGHRLWVARGTNRVTFGSDAIDLVHQYSGGVPRIINLLCDRALMVGAEAREHDITAPHVQRAAENLGLQPPTLARRPWFRRLTPVAALALVVLVLVAGLAGLLAAKPLATWVEALPPATPPAPRKGLAPPASAMPLPADPAPVLPPVQATPEPPPAETVAQ